MHSVSRTPRSRRPALRMAAVAVGLVLPPTLLATPASAARLPDLKVTSVTAAATVEVGTALSVTDTTVNAGRAKAGRTQTRYFLSKDRVFSGKDRQLGQRGVPALRPRRKSTGSVQLHVPTTTPTGGWFVVACADAKKQVRESKERNNCAATVTKVQVTAHSTETPTFPLEPDPLTVGVSVLEDHNAVTRLAFPANPPGGYEMPDTVIEAVADDGTSYTLTVPAESLLVSQEITMTPVASVADLPLSDGLVAGVQLEPHGLLLLEPATLTITRPEAVGGLGPLDAQTAFLFHEGGEDFHLYPVQIPGPDEDENTVRLSISHFSTPGLGHGTSADRNNGGQHPPARSTAQAESMISELLRAERASVLSGNPPNPAIGAEVLGIMNSYFDQALRSQLQAAEGNPDLAAQATAEGVAWARQVSLLGDEANPRIAEVWQRIERIWRNAMAHYWTRCTTDHDLRAISMLMGIARQAALFSWTWQDEAMDKAERCGNFEVRFDSRITDQTYVTGSVSTHDGSGVWRVKSTTEVPILGYAESVLDYTEFAYNYSIDYHEGDCGLRTVTTGTGTTPGKTLAMVRVDTNPRETPPGGALPWPDVTVRVHPASSLSAGAPEPTESYHSENSGCTTGSWDQTESRWWSHFQSVHNGQTILVVQPKEGDRAGSVLYTRTWNGSRGTSPNITQGTTTLEFWHKPLT